MFEDWFYPDNKNRVRRASELTSDCATLTYELGSQKPAIETALKEANEAISQAYAKQLSFAVAYEAKTIGNTANWEIKLFKGLASLVAGKAAAWGFDVAATAWLLRSGRLGEAAFIRQLGLPNWFKVGKFATGIGVLIGVELISDALQGAGTRSSLREVIQSLVSPRVRLKKAVMSNDSVLRCLSAVTAAYTAIANLPGHTLDENALQAVLQSLLADPKHKPADVTFEKAKETLAALDRGRSSWVDEDGAVTEEAA